MIRLENVCKTYKSKKGTSTQALKNVSINFPEKGLVCITGKSGSGKSTLLNVIGGLDKYDSGDIFIDGKSTKKFSEKNFDDYRNTYIGFIFQEFNLLEDYSIGDNIVISLKLQNKKASKEEVEGILNKVGLENIQKRKVNELSGGQKQRVAIARALIKDPKVIIADEPTGNLDSSTSKQIWELLKSLSKDRLVIVVTHDVESANNFADYEVKFKDGEVEQNIDVPEIKSDKEKLSFKSARLPFLYNLKMSFDVILHKKISLFFTTLLIVFSLICFVIMLFGSESDLNSKVYDLFAKDGEDAYVKIENYEQIKNKTEEFSILNNDYNEVKQEEITDYLKRQVERKTGLKFSGLYRSEGEFDSFIFPATSRSDYELPLYYYLGKGAFPAYFTDNTNVKIDNLIGKNSSNENEVVISSYLADLIIYNSCYAKDDLKKDTKEKVYSPKNYNEIVNYEKYVNFYNYAYLNIVGIYDVSQVLAKDEFDSFKRNNMAEIEWDREMNLNYQDFLSYTTYTTPYLYVTPSCIEKINSQENNVRNIVTKIEYNNNKYSNETISYLTKETEIYTNNGIKKIKSINNNEVLISEYLLDRITEGKYFKDYDKNINRYDSKEEYLKKYLKDNNIIGKKIKTNVSTSGVISDSDTLTNEYVISGIVDNMETAVMYYSKDSIINLMEKRLKCMELVTKVTNVNELKRIISNYPIDNAKVLASSKHIDYAIFMGAVTYLIQRVSKYGIILFMLFTIIIFMSFIKSSIKFRKKEIGILRALGCKSKDIIKMFFTESVIVMLLALIVTYFVTPMILSAFNNYLVYNWTYIDIDVISYSNDQMLYLAGIMFVITLFANIIPIRKITKMKPVDVILNKK